MEAMVDHTTGIWGAIETEVGNVSGVEVPGVSEVQWTFR